MKIEIFKRRYGESFFIGDAEVVIGKADSRSFNVITKTPKSSGIPRGEPSGIDEGTPDTVKR